MNRKRIMIILAVTTLAASACREKEKEAPGAGNEASIDSAYHEAYRPQFHFSPSEKWMNDPNGLVYQDGIYHLFYQYYPGDIVWGPMHWGHAVSQDLVFWEHEPIALYPDELGYIFSGSAVVDQQNTSGLGEGHPPLVAIFTYHDMAREKAGYTDYQTQGLAYSTDNGESWEKYHGNPIIDNRDAMRDFRDPKVFWHEASGHWILVLVAGDHARIYRSKDLLNWELASEFGRDRGAHGGVWECPDLFPLTVDDSGKEQWILTISINPGAPNGGSGTQYFIGNFNGTAFTSDQEGTRWLDWGTDNYAGVTYNNVPNGDRIFIGWMSNWLYARDTPTEKWRSAMTLPRKLALKRIGDSLQVTSYPLENLTTILKSELTREMEIPPAAADSVSFDNFNQSEIRFRTSSRDYVLTFKNATGDSLVLAMDSEQQGFSVDRSHSGKVGFQENFGNHLIRMPVTNLPAEVYEVRILMDWSSMEVFINEGQYVMTVQLFPNSPYTDFRIENTADATSVFTDFEVNRAESIWER